MLVFGTRAWLEQMKLLLVSLHHVLKSGVLICAQTIMQSCPVSYSIMCQRIFLVFHLFAKLANTLQSEQSL